MALSLPKGLPQLALTLVVGTGGGAVFTLLGLPLPWLLGALVAVMAAAFTGLPVEVQPGMRKGLIITLGVMLGGSFSPEVIERAGEWTPTLIAAAAYLGLTAVLAQAYCRHILKMDPVTAIFSSTPGGLTEMVILGEEKGADVRALTLVHSIRVASILLSIPLLLTYGFGVEHSAVSTARPDWALSDLAWLAGAALAGVWLGRLIHLPAYFLTGPMLASAALHLGGIVTTQAPEHVALVIQLAMGSALGARFCGMSPGQAGRLTALALVLAAGMMAMTLLMAAGLSAVTGFSFQALVLALSPGGFAEMALAALSMNIDPAFVTTHHALRLALVVFIAPIGISLWLKRRPAE